MSENISEKFEEFKDESTKLDHFNKLIDLIDNEDKSIAIFDYNIKSPLCDNYEYIYHELYRESDDNDEINIQLIVNREKLELDMKNICTRITDKFLSDLKIFQEKNSDKIACTVIDDLYKTELQFHIYGIIISNIIIDYKVSIPDEFWIATRIQGSPMFARNIWYIGVKTNLQSQSMTNDEIQKIGSYYCEHADGCF